MIDAKTKEGYDVERMHIPKHYGDRRAGRTVDAIADAIGKLMVTDNETIPFVIRWMTRADHIIHEFKKMCREHYNEEPITYERYTIGIKGFSSRITFYSFDLWQDKYAHRFHNIEAAYDPD